jgi:competence protein ComEC
LARELPLFTNQLDLLVIAAPRDENIGGLPDALARFQVTRTVLTSATSPSATYQTLTDSLNRKHIQTISAASLPAFDLGEGINLSVLYDGVKGSALRLDWNRASLMMPVGLERSEETALLMRGQAEPTTALLVADHGSDKTTQEKWVEALNPEVVLISVGAGNPDGDPSPDVLKRLAGRSTLRTDQNGSITILTDGQRWWVETER